MTGETLRIERERQKLTIQDIEQGTSIRAAYIEALENGDYDKLPSAVYAKGFVKNYANFLNLDADKLAKDFSAELSPPTQEEIDAEILNADEKVVTEDKKADKLKITEIQNPNVKVHDSDSASSSSSTMIIAAVLLIAIFAGGAWYYLKNSSENVANVNPPVQTEVTQPAENNQQTSPANNPVSAAVPQDGVNIQAKFNGECWTRVFVDGAFVYEGVPAAGEIMNWHGVEGVTIRVGNAAGIEVSMNGQNYGALGGIGEVLERTFTRQ